MFHKLLVVTFFTFLAFFAKSQVKQMDSIIASDEAIRKEIHIHNVGYPIRMGDMLSMVEIPANLKDTNHSSTPFIIKDQCTITKSDYPLIIIGGRRFKKSDFSNIFFDLSNLSNINVINPKNDSIKLFGRAGRNGVIILNTKNKIDWISSNVIRRQYFKSLFFFHKKAVFQINGVLADPECKTYIQKDLIVSITVKHAEVFYHDNEYHTVVDVTLKNVMGVSHRSTGK